MDNLPWAIDVSHHNGVIDWPRVAAQHPACIFIKATERRWTDPMFDKNRRACADLGLLWMPYVFLRPDDSETTFTYFLDVVDDLAVPAALDWEAEGVPSKVVEAWIAALPRPSLAYYGLHPPAQVTDTIARCPRWYPQYPGSATAAPRLPMWDGAADPDWRTCWLFWQWSDKAAIDGVSGSVDLNRLAVSAERFAGWHRNGNFGSGGRPIPEQPPDRSGLGSAADAIRAVQTMLLARGLLKKRDGSPADETWIDADWGNQSQAALDVLAGQARKELGR